MSEEETFDLENRLLCSDDTCIGVVGPDGKCKECGRPYEGTEQLPAPGTGPSKTSEGSEEETLQAEVRFPDEEEEFDPDERTPCSDETCIGVIGPDGRCGTCKKQH